MRRRFLPVLLKALLMMGVSSTVAVALDGAPVPVPPAAPRLPNLAATPLPVVPDLDFNTDPKPPRVAPTPGARDLRAAPRKPTDATVPETGDAVPVQPGKLGTAPTKVPGQLQKTQNVAPHATGSPDLNVDVNGRTSVGVFGEMNRIEREDVRTSTVKQGRDVGAGVTLQYKFGSP